MGIYGFFKDGSEWSMRRLMSFWAMLLVTLLVFGVFLGKTIDTQVIVCLCGVAGVGVASSTIKNKYSDK